MRAGEFQALLQFGNDGFDIGGGASHPFPRCADNHILKTFFHQALADITIPETGPVLAFRQHIQMQGIGLLHLPLGLPDTRIHIGLCCLANLD